MENGINQGSDAPQQEQPTFGMNRVRVTFNPSGNEKVNRIKQLTANLIDLMNEPSQDLQNGETIRLKSLAQTHYEMAAMWAVKAVTT